MKHPGQCCIEGCEAGIILARGMCSKHYTRWRRHGDPVGGGIPKGAAEAFIEQAFQATTDDCIEWPYAISNGYARIGRTTAHSVVCRRAHGPRPPHHQAAHSCGNRRCVNPRHIRWATAVENAADKRIHGTEILGRRNGSAKLDEDAVREIRRLREQGVTLASLAGRFGVSIDAVSKVHHRITWAHVT